MNCAKESFRDSSILTHGQEQSRRAKLRCHTRTNCGEQQCAVHNGKHDWATGASGNVNISSINIGKSCAARPHQLAKIYLNRGKHPGYETCSNNCAGDAALRVLRLVRERGDTVEAN